MRQQTGRTGPLLRCALATVLSLALVGTVGTTGSDASSRPASEPQSVSRHPKPKHVWSPRDTSTFNYPFAHRRDRYRIRHRVLAAIAGSPPGSQIRLTTFTFVDDKIARALVAARKRGVSVQLLVNRKDITLSPPYRTVSKALGHSRHGTPRTTSARASFARTCNRSCRGTGGNLHSKIFLFSQVGQARWVSMVGSANLSTKAFSGQWNHLDTVVDKATYARLLELFVQMKFDRVPASPFASFRTVRAGAWVFPRPIHDPLHDPMVGVLQAIDCHAPAHTGFAIKVPPRKHHPRKHQPKPPKPAKPVARRSVIRIGMYAWFDTRGVWLAREVRRKWNQGCDVRVNYAVLNGRVKRILYSPTGRGRIPMRRTVRTDLTGAVVDYNHSKYVAVSGGYRGKGRELVWTGSMNFTNLGQVSDDSILLLDGRRVFRSYFANFRRVWRSPHSHKPLPTAAPARAAGRALELGDAAEPELGSGTLRHLEQD